MEAEEREESENKPPDNESRRSALFFEPLKRAHARPYRPGGFSRQALKPSQVFCYEEKAPEGLPGAQGLKMVTQELEEASPDIQEPVEDWSRVFSCALRASFYSGLEAILFF